ncbi:hypothetical protein AzCIB_4339 [Azoarcus sp. CIB]|nr:hypothetical protein AzCIB_4339 [Azoarcus sp. CIB]
MPCADPNRDKQCTVFPTNSNPRPVKYTVRQAAARRRRLAPAVSSPLPGRASLPPSTFPDSGRPRKQRPPFPATWRRPTPAATQDECSPDCSRSLSPQSSARCLRQSAVSHSARSWPWARLSEYLPSPTSRPAFPPRRALSGPLRSSSRLPSARRSNSPFG